VAGFGPFITPEKRLVKFAKALFLSTKWGGLAIHPVNNQKASNI
jgi:hypothetical protein